MAQHAAENVEVYQDAVEYANMYLRLIQGLWHKEEFGKKMLQTWTRHC
jgi:hypothetical protein